MRTRLRGIGKEPLGCNGGEKLPGAGGRLHLQLQDGRGWPAHKSRHNGVGVGVKASVSRIQTWLNKTKPPKEGFRAG